MKTPHHRHLASLIAVATLTFAAGCHKKAVPPPPPPPPAATSPAPTATITVTPSTINPGGSAVLAWRTTDATDISIDGIGTVNAYGTQNVTTHPVDDLSSGRPRSRRFHGCDCEPDGQCSGCARHPRARP